MISICIPVFNFNIAPLVEALHAEILEKKLPAEILVIDDASEENFRETNRSLPQIHTYIQLAENVGRSKIRNAFLPLANFNYLLFLDCDSLICRPDFLESYLDLIKLEKPKVCYGGRIYPKICPSQNQQVSWKYGSSNESKTVQERRKNPYISFSTNNFLILKSVFKTIQFDESLSGYGHEDTLFAIELKRKQIPMVHLDNPVLNGEIETNAAFLKKTKQGIQNLVAIYTNFPDKQLLRDEVKLLRFYFKTKRTGDLLLLNLYLGLFGKSIERKLEQGKYTSFRFNCFKLQELHRLLREARKG